MSGTAYVEMKEHAKPGGLQCEIPGCDDCAENSCDNCDRRVCVDHIHHFYGKWHGDTSQCAICTGDVDN